MLLLSQSARPFLSVTKRVASLAPRLCAYRNFSPIYTQAKRFA